MRCKNCGWPNQPGETTCVKCHAPLDADNGGLENFNQQNANMHETVLEPTPLGANLGANAQNGLVCSQCGFPLRPNSVKCPKCGAPFAEPSQQNISRRGTVLNNVVDNPEDTRPLHAPHRAGNNPMKTINPYLEGYEAVPSASLKPFKRTSERKELPVFEFEGTQVTLKRSNVDPDNGTISSEFQAEILNEGGKWYIVDHSDAKTTFVRASEKVEIKDGSMILLGDRLFEFSVNS